MEQNQVDWTSFFACIAIVLLVCLPLAAFPNLGGEVLLKWYDFIAGELGFLYLLGGLGAMVLLAWLAFGPYGQVLLGTAGDRPEFSDYSWAAMLFCAGVGAGLMFWAPVEWAYYYDAPPFGVAARSDECLDVAHQDFPSHVPPIDMVGIFQPVDAEADVTFALG